MSTELATLSVNAEQIAALETAATECRIAIRNAEGEFQRSFAVATAMQTLDELVTDDMLGALKALEGHPLGFNTDKAAKGAKYDDQTIKRAFIEATLRGFYPVNNEFNIIAGRFYGARAGFERLVKRHEGLQAFEDAIGVPEIKGGWAFVPATAKWTVKGETFMVQRTQKKLPDGTPFDHRIPVRVNEGMGHDAILGKARRKLYAAIYEQMTGQPTPEGEVDGETIDVPSGKKVHRSTLFDDEVENDSGPAEDQAALLDEYKDKLTNATKAAHVGPVAKQAADDSRLTDETRKHIMEMCTARRKEL